jgi:hypothetical protein
VCRAPWFASAYPQAVPQHVHVKLERKAGTLIDALDETIDGVGGEWRGALSFKYLAAGGLARRPMTRKRPRG